MPVSLLLLTLVVYLLHQDFWFWRTPYPLVFGFMPIGLFYHACYSLLASLLMGLFVRCAWPSHLEASESSAHSTGGEFR